MNLHLENYLSQLDSLLLIMNELASKLQEYLIIRRSDDSIIVEDFEAFRFGFQTVKYTFTLHSTVDKEATTKKYILRMFPDGYRGFGAKNEFTIMDSLYKEGFPVPRVILFEEDKSILGKPFLMMEFIEHKLLYTFVLDATQDQQEHWMKKFSKLLVKLHNIDWKKIVSDRIPKNTDDPYFTVDAYIKEWELLSEEFGLVQFKPIITWLKKHRENYPAKRLGFIHRDYHMSNVLVAEDESMYVVDWAASNVADTRIDVARTVNVFTMLGVGKLVPLFLKYYEEFLGEPIGDLTLFEVATSLHLLLFCFSIFNYPDKESEEFKETLKRARVWLKNLYEFLVERTQIKIPEIEAMLE